mgnify:CR=1 FL=1
MSNVLKSVYFNVDAKQKHIIDSEQRMEELIPQMYTAEESKQDSYTFQPLTAETGTIVSRWDTGHPHG